MHNKRRCGACRRKPMDQNRIVFGCRGFEELRTFSSAGPTSVAHHDLGDRRNNTLFFRAITFFVARRGASRSDVASSRRLINGAKCRGVISRDQPVGESCPLRYKAGPNRRKLPNCGDRKADSRAGPPITKCDQRTEQDAGVLHHRASVQESAIVPPTPVSARPKAHAARL